MTRCIIKIMNFQPARVQRPLRGGADGVLVEGRDGPMHTPRPQEQHRPRGLGRGGGQEISSTTKPRMVPGNSDRCRNKMNHRNTSPMKISTNQAELNVSVVIMEGIKLEAFCSYDVNIRPAFRVRKGTGTPLGGYTGGGRFVRRRVQVAMPTLEMRTTCQGLENC